MEAKKYFLMDCPECEHTMEFSSSKKGAWVKCKKCKKLIVIPISGVHEYPNPKMLEEGGE